MNYCKSDGVSHNTATGFLNQADSLIIELGQRRQRSMEECTIPGRRRGNITIPLGAGKLLHSNDVPEQLPPCLSSLILMKNWLWTVEPFTVCPTRVIDTA